MSVQRITRPPTPLALYGLQGTRALEAAALAQTAPGALMALAGQRVAELALALAPHAQHTAILCGPGNNGGDGLIAAAHLHRRAQTRGAQVSVIFTHGTPQSGDAAEAWHRAQAAGVRVVTGWPEHVDLAIDAIFGIGVRAPLDDATAAWLHHLQNAPLRLNVDAPTGLDSDTGVAFGPSARHVTQQRHTLSLLTLKPGLFTAQGRDQAGTVWWDDLGAAALHLPEVQADAWLAPTPKAPTRLHAAHKGSFGQVTVIGGQLPSPERTGMVGAAILASRAALHAGAGRVYLCPLGDAPPLLDGTQADVMLRTWSTLDATTVAPQDVWLVGCGGGRAVVDVMPRVLAHADALVLDADALNAIASDADLQARLQGRRHTTVLTPHPLEAARLLNTSTPAIQGQRLASAQALADRFQAVVVLKGSGSIIAAPGLAPWINPTGNARLAIAGTGDVLAGMVAARLARDDVQSTGQAQAAVAEAVWHHGHHADVWPPEHTLTAQALVSAPSA